MQAFLERILLWYIGIVDSVDCNRDFESTFKRKFRRNDFSFLFSKSFLYRFIDEYKLPHEVRPF